MRHKHADLIIQWANGAGVEYLWDDEWWLTDSPTWNPEWEYRIRAKEPKWYENIPEHGMLCWAWDTDASIRTVAVISGYKPHQKPSFVWLNRGSSWINATPLTDDEIRQYLRGEK